MKQPQNLFLVGPMGAGKSAVGRQIAKSLHLSFVDSDEEIKSRTGVDIPFIFEKEGEEGFRKREVKTQRKMKKLSARCDRSMLPWVAHTNGWTWSGT